VKNGEGQGQGQPDKTRRCSQKPIAFVNKINKLFAALRRAVRETSVNVS
jgi:hypothetical protein